MALRPIVYQMPKLTTQFYLTEVTEMWSFTSAFQTAYLLRQETVFIFQYLVLCRKYSVVKNHFLHLIRSPNEITESARARERERERESACESKVTES